MLNISFYILTIRSVIFCVALVLFFSITHAAPVSNSGIDWDVSEATFNYFPEVTDLGAEPPAFVCHGQTIAITDPASDYSVTKTLSELGFSDNNDQVTFSADDNTECFQQAGDYIINVSLEDQAGNVSYADFAFTVSASTPSPLQSAIDVTCASNPVYANNSDECTLNIKLKDDAGNPVTQITSGGLYSTYNLPNDANLDTSFRDGLRYDIGSGFVAVPYTAPAVPNLGDFGVAPVAQSNFLVRALAPTIEKVEEFFSTVVTGFFIWDLRIPEINDNGTLSATEFDLRVTSDLSFKNLFALPITVDPANPPAFIEGVPINLETTLDATNSASAVFTSGIMAGASNQTWQYETNPPPPAASVYEEFPVTLGASFPVTKTVRVTDIAEFDVRLANKATYTLDGSTISHYAGGLHGGPNDHSASDLIGIYADTITVKPLGIDIEAGLLSNAALDTIRALRTEDGGAILKIGNQSAAQIRDQMLRNAVIAIRGISKFNTSGDDVPFAGLAFDQSSVILIEGADVVFPAGGTTLPTGKNTIVIRNGNLRIDGDIKYTAGSNTDSFGVMLINDEPQAEPNTGNIFVAGTVNHIQGNFYAEGGLMAYNPASGGADGFQPDDHKNDRDGTSSPHNREQLLFEGVLLSHNTIGGYKGGLEVDANFITPWESFADGEEGDVTDITSFSNRALRYDLHYVRRYNASDPSFCAPAAGNCDSNQSAFVLRNDGRASKYPPPGFADVQAWNLSGR